MSKLTCGLIEEYFTPKKVNKLLMAQLFTGVADSIKAEGKSLLAIGWRFYVVDQNRGRCYYKHKVITIPSWIFSDNHRAKGQSDLLKYKQWYICHEMAHALSWVTDLICDGHGPHFMSYLKRICPTDSIHFELEYKPRNAAAAGIKKPAEVFVEELGF